MLKINTLVTLVLTVATVTSAQQTSFLPKQSNMELYKSALEVENIKDIQNGCQYLAGTNFYDLQRLQIARPVVNITTYDGSGRRIFLSFCENLP